MCSTTVASWLGVTCGSWAARPYGAHHLTRQQQRRDLRRTRELGDAGWNRRGYVLEDVLHQGPTILRDADVALGRTHEPERIRAWTGLLLDSAFSVAGRHRLLRRWRS